MQLKFQSLPMTIYSIFIKRSQWCFDYDYEIFNQNPTTWMSNVKKPSFTSIWSLFPKSPIHGRGRWCWAEYPPSWSPLFLQAACCMTKKLDIRGVHTRHQLTISILNCLSWAIQEKKVTFLVPNQQFLNNVQNGKTNVCTRPCSLIKLHTKKVFDKPLKNLWITSYFRLHCTSKYHWLWLPTKVLAA